MASMVANDGWCYSIDASCLVWIIFAAEIANTILSCWPSPTNEWEKPKK